MCLDKLADFEVKQNWGWQCFRTETGEICARYSHAAHMRSPFLVEFDKWQEDPNEYQILNYSPSDFDYQTGFHVTLSKKGAESYAWEWRGDIVKKVYFRKTVAKGYQNITSPKTSRKKYKTIVARERYVCDKTKRPPKD